MSTATVTLSNTQVQRSPRHTATIYLKEAKYEFLKNLRLRMYTASVLSFPIMFYVLFGLVLNSNEAIGGTARSDLSDRDLRNVWRDGRVAVWNGGGTGLRSRAGMAAGEARQPHAAICIFRGEGCDQHDLQRVHCARAVHARNHLGGVRMPVAEFAQLLGTLVAGSLPFSAMGLALGYFTGPNSAPATINLIYLPMSFCSGLWVPFMFLPKVVKQIALALPPYHLSQLALGIVGAGSHESNATHWEVLAAFTMICLGVARIGFQRDQEKMYG